MPVPFAQANRALMRREFARLAQEYLDGDLTLSEFQAEMQAEIRAGVNAAFRFGKGGPLTEADRANLNILLTEQQRYLDRFIALIASQPEDTDQAWIVNRAKLYSIGAIQADALGTLSSKTSAALWTWFAADDPGTCATCESMSGVTRTADQWAASPVLPGVGVLCGPGCRCELVA